MLNLIQELNNSMLENPDREPPEFFQHPTDAMRYEIIDLQKRIDTLVFALDRALDAIDRLQFFLGEKEYDTDAARKEVGIL